MRYNSPFRRHFAFLKADDDCIVDAMIQLSVTIITFNEEANIARCLQSVKDLADEIIVIDSHSKDKTRELAEKMGAKVIERPFPGHIEQKNFAIEQAQFDWILSLDADEVLSDQLKKSILQVKMAPKSQGYYFNRLTNYAGFWVKHCGWYPDKKLRLFNKHYAKWAGMNPHDIIKVDPKSKKAPLSGDLLHYSYDSITDHVNQTNKFTTIAAKAAYQKGLTSNHFKIVTRPPLKFIRDYFWKKGFLDGRYGFIICLINSLSALLKYAKLKELQERKSID